MKLTNHTDIPEDRLREVIDFVRPNGVTNVDITVGNRSSGIGSGVAYPGSRRVVVRVDTEVRFPFHWTPSHEGGYIFDDSLRSQDELLVMLLAHELRHQWQFGVGVSPNERLRQAIKAAQRGGYYRGYTVPKVVHDPASNETVTLRGVTYYHVARVVKVRKVRRRPRVRRRGQHGGRERDADRYAMKMVRAWRRAHVPEPFPAAASVADLGSD